jgi:hypothetical protein
VGLRLPDNAAGQPRAKGDEDELARLNLLAHIRRDGIDKKRRVAMFAPRRSLQHQHLRLHTALLPRDQRRAPAVRRRLLPGRNFDSSARF